MPIGDDEMITVDLLMDDKPERFFGTPADIVTAMNDTAMDPTPDNASYMARFARFARLVNGQEIRTASEAAFVEDMIAAGLARRAD
jgi:hypothetical protein